MQLAKTSRKVQLPESILTGEAAQGEGLPVQGEGVQVGSWRLGKSLAWLWQ